MHCTKIKKARNKKKRGWIFFLLSILLLLKIHYVFSAGGGGGGGSSGGGSGGGSGDGPYFTGLVCLDNGVISFNQKPQIHNFTIESLDEGINITDIPGEWEGVAFTSDEAVMTKPGRYMIRDPKNGDRTFECPGLKFSCKLARLILKSCTISDNVTATFELANAAADDLKIQFSMPNDIRKIEYQKGSYSKELRHLKITEFENSMFKLETNATGVSTLQISIPKCVGKYYVYSKMDCVKISEQKKEEMPGQKLKCGGYLDIEDRVKCRIGLREAQKNEYENFFPEECKAQQSTVEQEKCLKFYQAVQECWDFPNGNERISCVKKQIKLGDVINEKANCNAVDSDKRENCNKELKEKGYALIKFRFYNLEEEAEHLMEESKLSNDDAVDFVVKMEQSKLAFNNAKTKGERKQVILQARQYWIELVKKIRK